MRTTHGITITYFLPSMGALLCTHVVYIGYKEGLTPSTSAERKYSKTCLKLPLKKDQNLVLKTDYRLMQVKVLQHAPREHSAILSICIKLQFCIKIFVLTIFE